MNEDSFDILNKENSNENYIKSYKKSSNNLNKSKSRKSFFTINPQISKIDSKFHLNKNEMIIENSLETKIANLPKQTIQRKSIKKIQTVINNKKVNNLSSFNTKRIKKKSETLKLLKVFKIKENYLNTQNETIIYRDNLHIIEKDNIFENDMDNPEDKILLIKNFINSSRPINDNSNLNFKKLKDTIDLLEKENQKFENKVSKVNYDLKTDSLKKIITNKTKNPNTKLIRKLNNFQNVYDSLSSDEYFDEEVELGFIIKQSNHYKRKFDYLILSCVLYYSIIEPFILAFSIENSFILLLETIMDFIFLIDIYLNFYTPYEKGDKIIVNSHKIKKNYLKTWFSLDIISSIPYNLIFLFNSEHIEQIKKIVFANTIFCIFKWVKICQLFKIVRGDTRGKLIDKIIVNEDSSINRTIRFVFLFLLLSHISTCIWIFIAKMEEIHSVISWINKAQLIDSTNVDIYISSLYFNLVTLFTIGYGDITSQSVIERIYNIFLLSFGVFIFSYFITSLSAIFYKINDQNNHFSKKLNILDEIYLDYRLSDKLYDKIKKNIENYKSVSYETFELLNSLPFNLRKQVIVNMTKYGIKSLNIFKKQEKDFIVFVLPFLRLMRLTKNETLISIGDNIEEMFIVKKGKLAVRLEKTYENMEIAHINQNMHFGEIFMYLHENSPYLVTSKYMNCEVFSIKKENFTKIKVSFNDNILKLLKDSCHFLEKLDNVKKVVIELFNLGFGVLKIKEFTKKIKHLLLKGQFDNFMENDNLVQFEEIEDFIFSNGIDKIIKFLKTDMNDDDFTKCFLQNRDQDKTIIDSNTFKSPNENFVNYLKEIDENKKTIDEKESGNDFYFMRNPTILSSLENNKKILLDLNKNKIFGEDSLNIERNKNFLDVSDNLKVITNLDQNNQINIENESNDSSLSSKNNQITEIKKEPKIYNIYNYGNNFNKNYFISNQNSESKIIKLEIEKSEDFSLVKINRKNKFEIFSNYSIKYTCEKLEVIKRETIKVESIDYPEIGFNNYYQLSSIENINNYYDLNTSSAQINKLNSTRQINLIRRTSSFHSNSKSLFSKFSELNNSNSTHKRYKSSMSLKSPRIISEQNYNYSPTKVMKRHSLFKEVNSGLSLDELLQKNKLVLNDQLNDIISEAECLKKSANLGLKRLDKLLIFIKENTI